MYVKITFNTPQAPLQMGTGLPSPGREQSCNVVCRPTLGEEKGEFTLLGKVTKHLEFFIVHLYIGLD